MNLEPHDVNTHRVNLDTGVCIDPRCEQYSTVKLRTLEDMSDRELLLDLHRKVDAIVEVVEGTVKNIGDNPMMKMLSKLAPKA